MTQQTHACFRLTDPVTASDWVQPFDRIGLNGGFRPTADISGRNRPARKQPTDPYVGIDTHPPGCRLRLERWSSDDSGHLSAWEPSAGALGLAFQ